MLLLRRHSRARFVARVAACVAVSLMATVALLAGTDAAAGARMTARWQLASTTGGATTTSTVSLTPSAQMTVVALRFRLPAGSGGRLGVHSTSGLGTGTLRGTGGLLTFTLSRARIVAAGRTVSLTLTGWHNSAAAGWQRLSGVVLVPKTGTTPAPATSNALLIVGTIATQLSATPQGTGTQLSWTIRLPVAPGYAEFSLDVPAELAGSPGSTSVTGLDPTGTFTRTATGLDYRAPTATPATSPVAVTVVATWPTQPSAIRDIPLAVTAGNGAGTTWATGLTRTPTSLLPASCGAFRSPGWVTTENALPADPEWQIGNVTYDAPTGWAGTTSAQCGDTVALHVAARRAYSVLAFRMGWYGGAGARLVWQSNLLPAVSQPSATLSGVNTVEAPWSTTSTLQIGTGWVPGDYLLELRDVAGRASYVPLTIRDDGSTSALLVQDSVLTWQAYNHWGQYSLYTGPDGLNPDRSRIVSFDRPYAATGGQSYGDGKFLSDDYSFVRFAEKRGMDVSYWTDLDLDRNPSLLSQHKTLVLLRHSEYWTQKMRDSVTQARDNGMNVAFLGANNVYWRARLEPDGTGDLRHVVVYRYESEDPEATPTDATTTYRADPIGQPEQRLIGVEYDCLRVDAPMLITDPTAWVFANANVTANTQLPDLINQEYDRFWGGTGGPAVEVLAHSPLGCPAHQEDQTFADMSYYNVNSGAGVFAVGTMGWEPALDNWDASLPYPDSERATVQQITENVLTVFAQGPAGNNHPAVPNSAALGVSSNPPPFQPETFDGDADADQSLSDIFTGQAG